MTRPRGAPSYAADPDEVGHEGRTFGRPEARKPRPDLLEPRRPARSRAADALGSRPISDPARAGAVAGSPTKGDRVGRLRRGSNHMNSRHNRWAEPERTTKAEAAMTGLAQASVDSTHRMRKQEA